MRPGLEELDAGFGQFSPHHTRDHAAYNPRYDGEDKVKRANVLMARRHEPAGKESRLVITVMMMIGMRLKIGVWCSGVSHILATLSWQLRRVQQQQALRLLQLRRPWHGTSEEHTSELQSLMRISSDVFCFKKKIHQQST